MSTGNFSTQNLLTTEYMKQLEYVRYPNETRTRETGVKVPKCLLSVTNSVFILRQWGCRSRSRHHLKKA